jgi:hypothetical protein
MIQGSEILLLTRWQNFYVIMGTAAATLTGLTFVAATLIAGIESQVTTLNAGNAAYNTPTIVLFGSVLVLAGIMSAPWDTFSSVGWALGLFGAGLVIYFIIVMQRMRRMPNYQTTVSDWLWYLALPLGAYLALVVAALMLPTNPNVGLYIIGTATIVLLFLGIHNAWDLVIFLAIERSHSQNKASSRVEEVQKVEKIEQPNNKESSEGN